MPQHGPKGDPHKLRTGPLDALRKVSGIKGPPTTPEGKLKDNPYAQALNMNEFEDIGPMAGVTTAGKGVQVGFKAAREKFGPIIEELRNVLRPSPVSPEDVLATFKKEKYTPFRVPPRTSVKVPEFAENKLKLNLPHGHHMIKRAPKLYGRQKLQGHYYKTQPDLVPPKYPGVNRPGVMEGSREIKKEIFRGVESPAVRGLQDLEDVTKVAPGTVKPPPPLSPRRHGDVVPRTAAQKVPLSKVSPELIEEIQRKSGTSGMSLQALNKEHYPYLTEETLRNIVVKMPWKWSK